MRLRRKINLPVRFRHSDLPHCYSRDSNTDSWKPKAATNSLPTPPFSPRPITLAESGGDVDDEAVPLIAPWNTSVDWFELSDGMKVIIFSELRKEIGFIHAVDFLQFSPDERNDLIAICKHEKRMSEADGLKATNSVHAQVALRLNGEHDEAVIKAAGEAEWGKCAAWVQVTAQISKVEVAKGKTYLLAFRTTENYGLETPKHGYLSPLAAQYNRQVSKLPTRKQISRVIESLDTYNGTGAASSWDDLGLGDIYFDSEEGNATLDNETVQQEVTLVGGNSQPGGPSNEGNMGFGGTTDVRKVRAGGPSGNLQQLGKKRVKMKKGKKREPSRLRNVMSVEDVHAGSAEDLDI